MKEEKETRRRKKNKAIGGDDDVPSMPGHARCETVRRWRPKGMGVDTDRWCVLIEIVVEPEDRDLVWMTNLARLHRYTPTVHSSSSIERWTRRGKELTGAIVPPRGKLSSWTLGQRRILSHMSSVERSILLDFILFFRATSFSLSDPVGGGCWAGD